MRASTLQRQVYWFLVGPGRRAALMPHHGNLYQLSVLYQSSRG